MLSLVNIQRRSIDLSVVLPALGAFVLPLTLLVPGLSVWGALPKLRVTRLHAISYQVSWIQLYATLVAIGVLLFCLLLELRRRRLDDMVETALAACEMSDRSTQEEKERLSSAAHACLDLLDSAVDHYEHVEVLRDELRRRRERPRPPAAVEHRPPGIEASDTVVPE
ncbi:hypothetical protein EVAR_57259_1 [Eumeta japonica]|uniref:Uncharacterized protein n=1 Tax=Eumeta variegata TaxID=151549 RepID=A0A4C1ZYU4_EUMVA|nr:hypothetical protein EVAR_57259_1 [Eumeta japonica]